MSFLRTRFALPVLRKELHERAENPRTYRLRVVYALILFGVFGWAHRDLFESAERPIDVLGGGHAIFDQLVLVQFLMIYLTTLASSCGVICSEKQRGTLGLLVLTGMSPSSILFQKIVSCWIPILTFLVLCLPLYLVCYSLGGLSIGEVLSAVLLLAATGCQLASLGVLLSTLSDRITSAFVGAVFWLGVAYVLCVPSPLLHHGLFPFQAVGRSNATVLVSASLSMLFAVVLLSVSARALVLRLETRGPKRGLGVFGWLDRVFEAVNRHHGNIRWSPRVRPLPGDRPVLWRERQNQLLTRPLNRFRVWLILIVVICVAGGFGGPLAYTVLTVVLWGLTAVTLLVLGATAFDSERSSSTLDLLLTTPLSGREIVLDTYVGARRLLIHMIPPFLFLVVVGLVDPTVSSQQLAYVFGMLTAFGLGLPFWLWVGLWLGLKVGGGSRAIGIGVGCLMLFCLAPYLISSSPTVRMFSPVFILEFLGETQRQWRSSGENWLPVLAVVSVVFLLLGLALRYRVLSGAARLLGRDE